MKNPRFDPIEHVLDQADILMEILVLEENQESGEKGKYGYRCTPHSCRRFFRTHASETLGVDLTEYLMRHKGYLTDSYLRLPDEEVRQRFHRGEHVLYITRASKRIEEQRIEEIRKNQEEEIADLKKRLKELEDFQKRKDTMSAWVAKDKRNKNPKSGDV